MARVKGSMLVGSVCLPDTETVFRQCTGGMPKRLKRLPDGETGERHMFTVCQASFFKAVPEMMADFVYNSAIAAKTYTPQQVADGIEKLKQAAPSTGYDKYAIESYAVFKRLRDEGVISKSTRFQVCLPSVASVMPFVQKDFQAAAEPVYQEALYGAMRNMQDEIPHEDLAIQIDLAADTALWENLQMYRPWFYENDEDMSERYDYIVNYITRMISQVDDDVELGIHNCYGDMEHRHWMEPTSLAKVTERGLALFENSPHPINFFHVPVPTSAMEFLPEYYEPLRRLLPKFEEQGTELYLGLVHANDLEGTQQRIRVAQEVLGVDFGVATECGWGRTPPEEIQSIMEISTKVSESVL